MVTPFQLRSCRDILNSQGVICYPTESVFGLGCDPLSQIAVSKILELKQRPVEKGLILIAANIHQLEPYVQLTAEQRDRIQNHPTPMTWLVNKSSLTPGWISGTHSKVAVRVSQHPGVRSICEMYGGAIVSTSANPGGAKAAATALQARQYFGSLIDMYIAGETGSVALATPITDIETGKKFR